MSRTATAIDFRFLIPTATADRTRLGRAGGGYAPFCPHLRAGERVLAFPSFPTSCDWLCSTLVSTAYPSGSEPPACLGVSLILVLLAKYRGYLWPGWWLGYPLFLRSP